MKLSVIICAHNPRSDYLTRTLDGLKAQTLGKEQWELLLIDNASKEPLPKNFDLSWHHHGRHVREDNLGLTPARLRGIREAVSAALVFVDDDNLLAVDYLEQASLLMDQFPQLGALGGKIEPEFESDPPSWTKAYWYLLAIRDFPADRISLSKANCETDLCGAGLVIRASVAKTYEENTKNNKVRLALDRSGSSLWSGGDIDLWQTCFDLNLGAGQFIRLNMRHLIPDSRLSQSYLLKLSRGVAASNYVMRQIGGGSTNRLLHEPIWAARYAKHYVIRRGLTRKFVLASLLGERDAHRFLVEKCR